MQKLYGTVVPIVTPLTEEDTIDVESLKNLVNHVIDGGLQCLYPCGTTGEMMYLTVEERILSNWHSMQRRLVQMELEL